MKIKTTKLSYEELLAKPEQTHKRPGRQSPFFRKVMKIASAKELKDIDFTYTEKGMEALGKNEPCLFLMNHSSFTDLQIAATYLADRPYHIVCTNDGLVGKEKLMRKLGCIPAKKFINDISLVKDMKYVVEKLNSSILMFPEASYSFDGTQTPLPDSIGKCVKLLKIPVVMIKTTGAFLRDPLYNGLQKRKVKVSAEFTYLINPEEANALTYKEINEILNTAFSYNHFEEQKKYGITVNEKFRADGLERVLYKCFSCGSEEHMEGKGTKIVCHKCGNKYELEENGELMPGQMSIPKWYDWERTWVKQEIDNGSYEIDTDVNILVFKDYDSIYEVGTGHLRHDINGFKLTGCDGKLEYYQEPSSSYSLYADYFWYEIGDMISIGDSKLQYYCFPIGEKKINVAKARLATEELYKKNKRSKAK